MLIDKLKTMRKQFGFTQKEVAEKLKVSRSTYNNYEQGVAEPDISTLRKLSQIFNTSIDDLTENQYSNTQSEEKQQLLKTIEKLTDIECHKLDVFAQGLIMNRNEEMKHRLKILEKSIKED